MQRFVAIWFRYLKADWYKRRLPALGNVAFVLALPDHGRMIVVALNEIAEQKGIHSGMAVADARAICPGLQVLDDKQGHAERILNGLAEWCIRYTPFAAVDAPDGLVLDATGCAHLWGGEQAYLTDLINRLNSFGYCVRVAMADTIGAAWAMSRYGPHQSIIEPGGHTSALLPLPMLAFRLGMDVIERLHKLGLKQLKDLISIPRPALRRRFGPQLLLRLDQALGHEEEVMQPVQPVEAYSVRLPCAEPILTRTGIEIALQTVLTGLCERLKKEGKGLRACVFKGFRTDGKIETLEIGTNRATHNQEHLFKLFELKLDAIEPALGIEFFLIEATKLGDVVILQEKLWEQVSGLHNRNLSELLDRLCGKLDKVQIRRYLPAEHYWPERAVKLATSLEETTTTKWVKDKPRPLQLLGKPEAIKVTAPIPDYPPMLFLYKGKRHKIVRAEGPERIEQEWWLQQGEHRDYYVVEDEDGYRYWLFRLGHYDGEKISGWFIHGFFA